MTNLSDVLDHKTDNPHKVTTTVILRYGLTFFILIVLYGSLFIALYDFILSIPQDNRILGILTIGIGYAFTSSGEFNGKVYAALRKMIADNEGETSDKG